MKIINLEQGSQEWLEYRLLRITGTDMSAIMGMNPWKTALDVYSEKMGLAAPIQINAAMQRGMDEEDNARELYNNTHGVNFIPQVIQSEKYPWAMASLDGVEENKFLEIKTPQEKNYEKLCKAIPAYYFVQMQMAFLSSDGFFDEAVFAVYSPENQALHETVVQRDEGLIWEMQEEGELFVERLRTFNPPLK